MKKNRQNKLIVYISNFFILLSFIGFAFLFYPLLRSYFPTGSLETIDKSSSIAIPKIGAYAPLLLNVDPWNETVYQQALRHGVAHAKGTSAPGDGGLVYVFAHSSGNPWEITHTNTVFLRLGELTRGDTIYIYREGKSFEYSVSEKKEVWPAEVSYLVDHRERDELILQTCTPLGTDIKRLLVFATPTN